MLQTSTLAAFFPPPSKGLVSGEKRSWSFDFTHMLCAETGALARLCLLQQHFTAQSALLQPQSSAQCVPASSRPSACNACSSHALTRLWLHYGLQQ